MTHQFEADLEPQTGYPRMRFNFDNGWSASVVTMMRRSATSCMLAMIAACPTGRWGTGATELLENEASADEVARYLAEVAARPSPTGTVQ